MDVHRDAAAIVADGHGAIHVDGDSDVVAVTSEVFINGIVQHFENAMMQTAFVRVANVHAGPLTNRFKTFKFIDL